MKKNNVVKSIVVISVVVFFVGFVIYYISVYEPSNTELPTDNYNIIKNTDIIQTSQNSNVITDTTIAETEIIPDFDISVNENFTDPSININYTGLNAALYNLDENAITVNFDNIKIRAGMKLSEITENSDYYVLQNGMLESGNTMFLYLYNNKWSEKSNMAHTRATQNGNIILWIKNYTDGDLDIKDCVIYKFQISYLDSYHDFFKRPEVSYYNFTLGTSIADISKDSTAIESEMFSDDNNNYYRVVYGDINTCQATLDVDYDDGLMGITISYNPSYGPDFKK